MESRITDTVNDCDKLVRWRNVQLMMVTDTVSEAVKKTDRQKDWRGVKEWEVAWNIDERTIEDMRGRVTEIDETGSERVLECKEHENGQKEMKWEDVTNLIYGFLITLEKKIWQ